MFRGFRPARDVHGGRELWLRRIDMTIEQWLEDAKSDAYRRKMPELADLLDGLAQVTTALRAADWNDDAETEGETLGD